ncbi:hypothetical protein GCM10027360_08480 [Amycolatopsis echigonensis]
MAQVSRMSCTIATTAAGACRGAAEVRGSGLIESAVIGLSSFIGRNRRPGGWEGKVTRAGRPRLSDSARAAARGNSPLLLLVVHDVLAASASRGVWSAE